MGCYSKIKYAATALAWNSSISLALPRKITASCLVLQFPRLIQMTEVDPKNWTSKSSSISVFQV